jgi:Tartrate dehydratase alpha subunit/Fumarate hydratase class I, N-terminal domain
MANEIVQKVADCLVRAGSTFREDQKEAYRRAIGTETNGHTCWVMKQVLDNALVAEERRSPLCDDTGIPICSWKSVLIGPFPEK